LLATTGFSNLSKNTAVKSTDRYKIAQDRAPQLHRKNIDIARLPEVTPKLEAKSKYGNPKTYKVFNKEYKVLDTHVGFKERGIASWYGEKFHGHRTSSGEPYDMYQISAAHPSLPLPTYARVTNLENKKSIIVKINDRGPFHANRVIDLSYAAAQKLGVHGTARVEIEALHANQGYYLQLGAFGVKNNAAQLVSKVKSLIKENIHLETDVNKKLHYVRIGPMISQQKASELMNNLQKSGLNLKYSVHVKS
jgi:rare lipoprotein A